ncbi:hypothetical protein BGZ50_009344 [Haplosporangium sp. Z 11]|nr:hypothetical protein BGZ50_009344 [Haplosporangium sp. Z 11]
MTREDAELMALGTVAYSMLRQIQAYPTELADIVERLVAKKATLVLPTCEAAAVEVSALTRAFYEDHVIIPDSHYGGSAFITLSGMQGSLEPASSSFIIQGGRLRIASSCRGLLDVHITSSQQIQVLLVDRPVLPLAAVSGLTTKATMLREETHEHTTVLAPIKEESRSEVDMDDVSPTEYSSDWAGSVRSSSVSTESSAAGSHPSHSTSADSYRHDEDNLRSSIRSSSSTSTKDSSFVMRTPKKQRRRRRTSEDANRVPSNDPNIKDRFRCDQCGKTFSRATNLRSHRSTHAGIKPFVCEHVDDRDVKCGAAFARRHDLARHAQSRHVEKKTLFCNSCGVGFARRDAYLRHLTNHPICTVPPLLRKQREQEIEQLQEQLQQQQQKLKQSPQPQQHIQQQSEAAQLQERDRVAQGQDQGQRQSQEQSQAVA